MNQPIELSLEQEFSVTTFADVVKQMSREQARIVFADAVQADDDKGKDLPGIAQTSGGSWFRFNLGLRQTCSRYFKRLRR
nr:NblA/ycf18 family protein [Dendronalium phyllosphericum]